MGVTPAFSYLATLSNSAPATGTSDVPYYFTTDSQPAAEASPAIQNYLDALAGPNNAAVGTPPTGGGMAGYLDALPANSNDVAAPSSSGSGMNSYAESLNAAGAAAVLPQAAPVETVAPAEPVSFEADGNAAVTTANYMDALGSGDSSIAGAGIGSYLDALPNAPGLAGGAGITTYLDSVPAANVAAGGAGIQSHTDSLNSNGGPAKGSWAPGAGSTKPAFTMGSISGKFDFNFEADASIIEKIAAAGDRRVVLKGTVDSVSYS